MRLALVGTGGIAPAHVEAVRAQGGRAELVAAVDVDAARLAAFREAHGIPAGYDDLDRMLAAERPDLVLLATPPALHAEQCVRCLEAGAWVLCEKPLAGSLADLDRIAEAEARTGRACASVYQWRFGAGARHVKALLDEGALGRPLLGLALTTWQRDAAYYAVPWRGRWDTELGGCTTIHGIHAIDLLLWLFGDWSEVSAMAGTLDHAIEVEDVSLANVRFANGALGALVTSVVSPRQESVVRLDLQRATVELTHLYAYRNDAWRITPVAGPGAPDDAEVARWRALPDDAPSLHAAQLTHVLDALAAGERPITSGPGARATLELLTSLYKAAFTGERVARGSIVPGDPYYDSLSGGEAGGREPVGGSGRAAALDP